MSTPKFPDPLGAREVDRPGARAHKAGPDMVRRVAALEEGAAANALSPESLLTTRGDLVTRDATGPVRKGIGSAGQVLYSDGTDPQYGNLNLYAKRLVFQAHGYKFSGAAANYILGSDTSTSVASPVTSATTLYTVPTLRLVGADYAVTGKTTKLTLDSSILTNGTAPGVNVLIALLPITAVAGAANALSFTLGAAVGTITYTTPSANGHHASTNTIDIPSDGLYVAVLGFGGSQAGNSMVAATVRTYISWT